MTILYLNQEDIERKKPMIAAREKFEKTATSIASLGRNELKKRIKNFRGRFRLDFTEDYLDNISEDRLRHILLAAVIINTQTRS